MSTAVLDTVRPAVIPYYLEKHTLPENILGLIYRRLASEDILSDLVPESDLSEQEFVQFANGPALLNLFLDLESGRYAGLAWITDIEEGRLIKKGCASVAFFKDWWKPRVTEQFGKICLSQWFEALDFNIVYGMTPTSNVAAMRYSRRIGFQYEALLPKFTSRRGVVVDAAICVIRKDRFRQLNGTITT